MLSEPPLKQKKGTVMSKTRPKMKYGKREGDPVFCGDLILSQPSFTVKD